MGRCMEDDMEGAEVIVEINTQEFFGSAVVAIHNDGDVIISDYDSDMVCMSKDCAISAARAILKYFEVE